MTYFEPVLCSVAQAALALGIGKTKTYELISEGLLDTVTIGTRRLVTVESIRRLVEKAQMDEAA
ncbi:helix-turn-helix domain-containing protein [Porphyrobacter sp. LM 6]|uniref:helix-turn-helix domain-containing protein n=1 Tax=Porphyrobacter sp. LM 6 TaxID=1896196 RepID=UPI000847BCD2|nr:helix-turn-helix domain-containing protein [Porphyrobacter sp. LM 6]AOL94498.1 DNA binding domain-containing protein, excisionase family [Porphyrobacter sp. LM 6]